MSLAIVLGLLANACFIFGGFFKQPRNAMICALIGNLVYILYYVTINLYTPLISLCVGALSGYIILNLSCPKHIAKIACFAAFISSALILMNSTFLEDGLLLCAAWCICYAQMNKSNYVVYKLSVSLSQILWIIYCLTVFDYAMLTTCIFILTTNTISLIYYKLKDNHVENACL